VLLVAHEPAGAPATSGTEVPHEFIPATAG
jgi:hypothetical protein